MTGFNLPPGCTQRQIDEAAGAFDVCDCCGHQVDDCCCDECPVCGEVGNPACYDEGHESDGVRLRGKMEYTPDQEIGRAKVRIARLKEQIMDEEMFIAEMKDRKWAEESVRKREADH